MLEFVISVQGAPNAGMDEEEEKTWNDPMEIRTLKRKLELDSWNLEQIGARNEELEQKVRSLCLATLALAIPGPYLVIWVMGIHLYLWGSRGQSLAHF